MKKFLIVLFLGLMPVRGWAGNPLVNPWMIVDPVRSAVSFILTLLHVSEDPILGAWFHVTQEEVAGYVGGEGEGAGAAGGAQGSPATAVPAPAYDYVRENILSGSGLEPYAPVKSATTKEAIKKLFFFDTDKGRNPLTETKKSEIMKKRTDYLTALGREYTKIAYELQQKVIENMDSMSADIGGAGTIGGVSALDQTWQSINKTLVADIAVQIQLMELDAARFLSVQPVEIVEETIEKQRANAK